MNTKRFTAIALILMLALSHAAYGLSDTPSGKDPCPCCPDCVQEECVCAECGDSDNCKCSASDIQYNWRIVGEGEQPFTIPGMIGTNKMIVKMDMAKYGGATPVGTYMGTFYFWHYEMTPELMKASGATGDSYNEYETDDFAMDIIFETQNKEWSYQTMQEINITITSVTDVTIAGRKQQVTDYPSQSVKFAFDINPDTGKVRMAFTLGKLEPFIFDDFQIEQSEQN